MELQKRSVGLCIVLSLVTCGIYSLYWLYSVSNDLRSTKENPSGSAALDVVLSLITCGIYSIYLMYCFGKDLADAYENADLPREDQSVLYLILALLVSYIIPLALVQDRLNRLVDAQ